LSIGPQGLPGLLLTLQEGCVGQGRLAVEEMCCEDELFLPIWEESYVMALHPQPDPQCGRGPAPDGGVPVNAAVTD